MPTEVRTSFLLWLTAIAAGVFETVVVILDALAGPGGGSGLIAGVALRLAVFLVAIHVITQMALGRNWARITLAVLLGGLGTLSLVVGPMQWLAAGHSLPDALAGAGPVSLLFGTSRVVHVVAVLTATAYMFRPAANRYFRTGARRRLSRV